MALLATIFSSRHMQGGCVADFSTMGPQIDMHRLGQGGGHSVDDRVWFDNLRNFMMNMDMMNVNMNMIVRDSYIVLF